MADFPSDVIANVAWSKTEPMGAAQLSAAFNALGLHMKRHFPEAEYRVERMIAANGLYEAFCAVPSSGEALNG